MAEENPAESPEGQADVSAAFLRAAAEAALTPVMVNRFQLMQTGMANVLALGSGGLTEMRNASDDSVVERQVLARVVGVYAINKEFAADLALFLTKEFNIDEAFFNERRQRYPAQFAQEGDNG